MQPIRVLVVDDSAFIRAALIALLSTDPLINVVGEAANGLEAVQKFGALKPDLVTMDVIMPIMDGLAAIEHIMSADAVPILVLTAQSDAHTAYTAITKGALEVLPKPELDFENAAEFTDRIRLLSKVKVIAHIRGGHVQKDPSTELSPATNRASKTKRIIAVASSTGGPNALSILFASLPASFPHPIVVAQHIQDEFIPGMVKWLDGISRLAVKQGKHREKLRKGVIYVSPSERHMVINTREEITLLEREPDDMYFPSCDKLLSSVATVYGSGGIGIVLSGMGDDGVLGIEKIKASGGTTVAQDEKSSIVFGMPMAAIKSGYIDKVLPLDKISNEIVNLAQKP